MLEEHATVVALDNEYAELEIIRKKPCGLCGKTRGCGVSMWGKLFNHRQKPLRLHNSIHASLGDDVVIGLQQDAFLKSSLYLYGIPLLTLLGGAMLGSFFAHGEHVDAYAVIGALLGLALGYIWLKGHQAGIALHQNCQPVLLRVEPQSQIQKISICERSH